MTTEQLASRIHPHTDWYEFDAEPWCKEAAAELRRLAAENESAHIVGIRQEREIMALEAENKMLREILRQCASVLFDSRHGEPCNRKEVRDLSAAIDEAIKEQP